jgi:hypothetical protein
MHTEAERTERTLLPEVVAEVIQRSEARRRAPVSAARTAPVPSPQPVRRRFEGRSWSLTAANVFAQLKLALRIPLTRAQNHKRQLGRSFNPQVLGSSPSGGTSAKPQLDAVGNQRS